MEKRFHRSDPIAGRAPVGSDIILDRGVGVNNTCGAEGGHNTDPQTGPVGSQPKEGTGI